MIAKYLWLFLLITLAGCKPPDQAHVAAKSQPVAESAPNLMEGIDFKKVGDIDLRFKAVTGNKPEDLAAAITEVDGWLYAPEDEKPAQERINSKIEKLRARIESEVTTLSKEALAASNGTVATEKMSKINSLLTLYPSPDSDVNRKKLETLSAYILSTSRRVEDIRRLRYNSWAIVQIQTSLKNYQQVLKIKTAADIRKLVMTDKDTLITVCVNSMSTVDPTFLDPAVMDLYNYAYGLTRDAMGSDEEHLIKLAQGFANSNTKRYTPSNF